MENTVGRKLEFLQKLQSIDSEIDALRKVRGALPEEIMDMEDEMVGYNTRVEKQAADLADMEDSINASRIGIKDAQKLIKKYEEQQTNVRNNREYDAITKEVELQQLEIQIIEKRIKDIYEKIGAKQEEIKETESKRSDRKTDLNGKKEELEHIVEESEADEKKFERGKKKASKQIEDRLLKSYEKVRTNMRNGLAVVSVMRGACGGCFNIVPPQKQAEIREQKKVIVCEHCGRIIASVVDEVVKEEKPKRGTKRATKTKKESPPKE